MQLPSYNTFRTKNEAFHFDEKQKFSKIKTLQQYEVFYNSETFNNSDNIYRGVNEAKYKLFTSVQRAFIEGKISTKETIPTFITKEIKYLKQNQTLARYYSLLGIPITDFLYLSFLQHYSAPTTFLDFSHNRDKALYFATEGIQYGEGSKSGEIDEYFSIYWIDMKRATESISILKSDYVDALLSINDKLNLSSDFNEKKLSEYLDLEDFLSWKGSNKSYSYLSSRNLAFIDINRKNESYKNFLDFINSGFKLPGNVDINKLLTSIIDDTVRIVNLNLIAQDGCFIHYIPSSTKQDLRKPLELFLKKSGIVIHCANIHKSLAPYIISQNRAKSITKETIYPDPRAMAHSAMMQSIIDL